MKKILKFAEIAPKIKKEIKHLSYADRSRISSQSRNDLFEYYNSTLEINADFNLDFKEYNYEKEARGIIIDGDLIVNGDIINESEDLCIRPSIWEDLSQSEKKILNQLMSKMEDTGDLLDMPQVINI